MNRIGTRLVARGLVEPDELRAALERQQSEGGYLGQLLLDAGALSRQDLHQGLAEQWGLAWRDLDQDPPDAAVLATTDVDLCMELGWLPCEITDHGIVVATSVQPGPDLLLEIDEHFPGTAVHLVACTRRDLDHVAAALRRYDTPLAVRSSHEERPRMRTCALTGVLAVGVVYLITLAVIAPPGLIGPLLAAAGSVFLAAMGGQCFVALRHAARTDEVRTPGDNGAGDPVDHGSAPYGAGDLLLPVYSVVVSVPDDAGALARAVADLATLDYPRFRLDVVMVVPDGAQDAVRRAAPPDWVRVVVVPREVAMDPVRAYDEGLALARGRYVVAYGLDEVPEPQQLRQAVAAFEADLAACLAGRQRHPMLMRLDVDDHIWGHPSSLATGAQRVEAVLGLDRAQPVSREPADTRPDWTSSHFNTRVLRRLGGWSAMTAGGTAARSLPTDRLLSRTHHRRPRGPLAVLRGQILVATGLLDAAAARMVLAARAPSAGAARPMLGATLLSLAGPGLLLAYPPALVAATVFVARFSDMTPASAWTGVAGIVALASGLLVAVATAAALVAGRHGWRAAVAALTLPVTGLAASAAAWHALLVVIPCRRARRAPRAGRPMA